MPVGNPYMGMSGAASGASSGSSFDVAQAGGNMLQDFSQPIFSQAGNAVSDWLFGKKKKAPAPPTGQQLGASAFDYYKNAFPGTSPWDWLGTSNPAGGVAESFMSSNTQRDVARGEQNIQRNRNSMEDAIHRKQLKLESKKIDLEGKKVAIEDRNTQVHEKKLPFEQDALKNNNLLRTLQQLFPDWMLQGAIGIGGAAGLAGRASQAILNSKRAGQIARFGFDKVKKVGGNIGRYKDSFKGKPYGKDKFQGTKKK